MNKEEYNKQIAYWLFIVCGMIFVMIVLGGITRLTESGLSMVHWKPLSGVIPPLSEASWQEEFSAYKNYPEYKEVNTSMTLQEFKGIFFWEYTHRMLGRIIGITFFVPFVFFLMKRRVAQALKPKLWILFALGMIQGFLGWWMVKSGLVDQPDVSHYRLTIHLGMATLIYAYLFWVASGLVFPRSNTARKMPSTHVKILISLIFIQILFGGMVAGLNAGMIYNTWPLMGEHIIPPELFVYSPWYINFFENMATIQFNHRVLAYLITLMSVLIWLKIWREQIGEITLFVNILVLCVFFQMCLGIATLILQVPIAIAVLHQAGAIILLTIALILLKKCQI